MKVLVFSLVAAMFAGCATIGSADNYCNVRMENGSLPIETVMIENSGWLLFSFIPIASGNPKMPNRCSFRLFEDTTTLQNNLDILEIEMKRVGATKFANLYSKTIDESVMFILFTRTACQTSAVLLK